MSLVCRASQTCPFAPEQTTGGCPCAELCPGFTDSTGFTADYKTTPDNTIEMEVTDDA